MDTILGILQGESYSGIHALTDLSVCVKYTNNSRNVYVILALAIRYGRRNVLSEFISRPYSLCSLVLGKLAEE